MGNRDRQVGPKALAGLDRIQHDVSRGEICPVYLWMGPDVYSKRKAISLLAGTLLGAAPDSAFLDVVRLQGDATSSEEITAALETGSLFGPDVRLAYLTGVEQLPDESLTRIAEDLVSRLQSQRGAHLILAAESMDRRRRAPQLLEKALADRNAVVPFPWPAPHDLPGKVDAMAAELGLTWDQEARQYFLETVGSVDLELLHVELEKLSLYAHPDGKVSTQMVDAITSAALPEEENFIIFRFTESLSSGQVQQAMSTLRQMLDAGRPPLVILAMAARHFRLARALSDSLLAGQSLAEAAKSLGISTYEAEKLSRQVGRAKIGLAEQALELLAEADLRMKRVWDPVLILENTVCRLALLFATPGRPTAKPGRSRAS